MKTRPLILTAILTSVALGGVGAALIGAGGRSAGEETGTVGNEEKVDLSGIDTSGEGFECLGGLCKDNLPAEIRYEKIGAYLHILKTALEAAPNPDNATACHVVSHEIGRRAEPGRSVKELLELDDGRCLYGYQHGVLEGWSLRSNLEKLIEGISEACQAYEDGSTMGGLGSAEIDYARGSCAHGVGHAIALQKAGSVLDAVLHCQGLGEGQIGGCAGGVFMAYAATNPSQGGEAEMLPLDKGEVLELCDRLEGEYRVECWSKLWLLGIKVGIGSLDVARICPQGPDGDDCGWGVGQGLYYEHSLDAGKAMSLCPSNVQPVCTYGVAWSEANSWAGSGGRIEEYQSVCGGLSETERVACLEAESEALRGTVS